MTLYLDRLLNERTSLTGVMTGLRDRAAGEERDLTDSERSEIARLQERCVEVDALLTEHEAQTASARSFADLQAKIEAGRESTAGAVPATRAPLELTSPGAAFVASEAFTAYDGHGKSSRFPILDYLGLSLEARAPITTSTLPIPAFTLPPQEVTARAPLVDLANRVAVSSGVVEWVEVGADPEAAVVAEGAAKPEATLTFTPASSALDTIAHWVQITRQALEDASYIRSLVEGKLRRGLLAKIEADIAALLTASTAIGTATGADLMASIRAGISEVESAGYRPNAVALNPADTAELDTAMFAITGNPSRSGGYWGLTVVSDPSITAGNAYVGDFTSGLTLFDRGVTDVFMSDSHADLFIKNILVILAEARVKSAITDPLAICECTVTP